MSNRRMLRVNEAIRREVCLLLQREIRDPRVGFITVMGCNVTSDLREARVYVSVLGDKKEKEETMEGLQSATPFIQSKVGKVVNLRYTPKITFFLDESAEKAAHIDDLLKKIKKDD